ncbi:hypothetical protein [Enterocloster bolteae]|uniref:hypothetical protein n=2 Tax=Enterocloster bolteae TaxID=208479 RepID=UPI002A825377|nr:hypothetical protein [Enterocloster bolteae]
MTPCSSISMLDISSADHTGPAVSCDMTGTAPYLVCKGRHPHQRRYGKSVSAHPEHRRHIRKQRKESCGSHYREDSPDTDDAHYLHRISIGLEEKMKKEAAASQFFTCEAAALSNIRASAL